MKSVIALLVLVASVAGAVPAVAQARQQTGALRVIVRDPSGAVIPGATVEITGTDAATQNLALPGVVSDGQGIAIVRAIPPGKYAVTVSFPGFEPRLLTDLRIRAGETRRDVTLAIQKVAETVAVGRDPATAGSDPKSERFSNVLSKDQIAALPDDPDEMEQVLKDMAGPGAVIRVDGFRGGKLPPKSQIRSIRFSTAMFAAENHSAGHTFVDITTQPGLGPLRGGVDFTFRDGAMNARNAFQTEKGPEQTQQYTLNLSGTLIQNRTSFSLFAAGASLYDSANIFAALPGGSRIAPIRRPADRLIFNGRLDHALSKAHTLRASFQRNDNDQHNLGIGNFDLADRGFARTSSDSLLRISENGPLAHLWFGESRLQVRRTSNDSISAVEASTVRVLDAFTSGGAQQGGGRRSTELEYATDVDYAAHGHALRLGTLVEGGVYRSDTRTNYLGTYTFPSLADFNAGRPATYSIRTGNPLVEYSQWQAGLYLQDDWRIRKNLTLNGGIRQEFQTNLGNHWNLAPRGGLTWSPFKNGKTTVRAGGGLFYDWLDAETVEQTLRVDGVRQQDLVILNPGYPDPYGGDTSQQVLPPSKYLLAPGLVMPKRATGLLAVTRQLSPTFTVNVGYSHAESWNRFRGRNINAPLDGLRPNPALGNITEVESTARLRGDTLNVGMNFNIPARKTFLFANYAWSRQQNDADGPFSLPANNYDLAAEWGRAAGSPRHTASAVLNTTVFKNLKVAVSTTARSGAPYNITAGRDDNGDTVFTDRPAGVGRNTGMSTGIWDVAARVGYAFGFGERSQAGGGGTQITIVQRAGGGAGDLLSGLGVMGGADNKRVHLELFASAANLFNNVNLLGYSGVMTSPFFGRPTAAGPARKLDVGMKIGF